MDEISKYLNTLQLKVSLKGNNVDEDINIFKEKDKEEEQKEKERINQELDETNLDDKLSKPLISISDLKN